jgi:hypothetical protein
MALIMVTMVFLPQQRITRKKEHPLLTVSDRVYIFASVLPSRINNLVWCFILAQAIEIVERSNRTPILRRCGIPPLLWIYSHISYRFIRINRKIYDEYPRLYLVFFGKFWMGVSVNFL